MTDLYFPASPPAYSAARHVKKGFLLSVGAGAGNVDYDVRGIVAPYCTTGMGVCKLEESAAFESTGVLGHVDAETRYIEGGDEFTAILPLHQEGFDPLRTLFVSEPFGGDIPGGKTLYGIEVISDCQDAIYVGVARRVSHKEPFNFKRWQRIQPYAMRARIPTSGIEFKVLVFTVGAGVFRIDKITVWLKLTDRRGFNTFPQGGGGDSQNAAD